MLNILHVLSFELSQESYGFGRSSSHFTHDDSEAQRDWSFAQGSTAGNLGVGF